MIYVKRENFEHRVFHPPCGHAEDLCVRANETNGGRPGWCFEVGGYEESYFRFVSHCSDCGAALPRLRWYGKIEKPAVSKLGPKTELELLIGDRIEKVNAGLQMVFFSSMGGKSDMIGLSRLFLSSRYGDLDPADKVKIFIDDPQL